MIMPRIDVTKNYCRKRIVSPKVCALSSFRVKAVKKGVKLTICCPKGSYDRKTKRCKVGTITQSIMKRKTRAGTCPRM